MLKLRPRRRIDPAKIPKAAKPVAACCAFCGERIVRARPLAGPTRTAAGRCRCGAYFVSDENGKLAGEALLAGLHLLALGDPDEAMALREGMDYEARALAYDERRHEVQPGVEPNRYGVSRMWYFRSLR
ncbi:MAG: hypothetical protein MUF54_03725 [Polyangiaceae bacterium]|jgi:hypothetical protein|nr:hypothetical protein [Polyangiaceae bacterium]